MIKKLDWMLSFFILLLLPAAVCGGLTQGWDVYDLWMVQEEDISFGKKAAYERGLQELFSSKKTSKKQWPCYIIEGLDESKYLFLYPLKNYGSLDTYFEEEKKSATRDEELFVNFSIRALLHRLSEASYLPDVSHAHWEKTPFLYYWVVSVKAEGEEEFERHLFDLVQKAQEEASALAFRSWKVTFGFDLPKYIVVLFAPTQKELLEKIGGFPLVTDESRRFLRGSYEGKGRVRSDLKQRPCP